VKTAEGESVSFIDIHPNITSKVEGKAMDMAHVVFRELFSTIQATVQS
jgi:hypothetical protein